MVDNRRERLPHLLLSGAATNSPYTRPRRKIDTPGFALPQRNRQAHAGQLLNQLNQIQQQESRLIGDQKAFGLDAGNGIYLSFESEPDFELKFQSLEFERSGIELCAVKHQGNKTIATVFVPEGKIARFINRLHQYRDQNTVPRNQDAPRKPKNKELVESISAIKLAVLDALWTDDPELFPQTDEPLWWEVWLRNSDRVDYEAFLREHAEQLEMTVSQGAIPFLDRTVVLVRGTKDQMSCSVNLLGSIAELRRGKETADFFTGMDRAQQRQWIDDAVQRTTVPPRDAPSICLLDTGVNEQHPLLEPATDTADMHTCDPAWGTDDRHGHGTPMAGLAIYGDLTERLASSEPIELTHRLESVKIIPAPGHHNEKKLYGAITRESISRVEIDPDRQRVFCMALTANDDRDRGRPSSWSAAIDALASGYEDEQCRLIILSAGNTDPSERHRYPDSSFTDEVHDPGQAWNALTVGAHTEKAWLDATRYPGWQPIAPLGDLSPSSCTSTNWVKTWPIKPDIVMEGGNMATSPEDGSADYIDDALQLVSTGHDFALGKQLIAFGDTSAATALAARLAATVQAQYPEYWPETLRALLVHSAQWTDAMKARFNPLRTQDHYRQLLRYCGYGTPNVEELLWSARDALTLITQDRLRPFDKRAGEAPKTRDINLHTIPWPTDILRDLGEAPVEMKVTLSYFIEPNPGERGWANKYRYASHGLRFDVRRSLESLEDFQQRLNQQARDEEHHRRAVPDKGWLLGENLRGLGSIHSDTWQGTAAELAERNYIAVYPVLGWWKERVRLQRWHKAARYALIISIKTPGVETDIYTAVENQITTTVELG